MKKIFPVLPCLLLLAYCTQNKKEDTASNGTGTPSKDTNTAFIPVTAILQGEINKLDSLPVTILQIKTVNKKADSAWLPATAVKPLLQPFLSTVIDEKNLAGLFKETKFNDQGTGTITFTYDPKTLLPDSLPLRRWDVYFDPEKNIISRVYMVKQVKENGIAATQQLTWQSGKWAKLVTINNDKAAINPVMNEIKWVWDLSE